MDRLQALQDQRSLNIALCIAATTNGNKEALPEMRTALLETLGTPIRFDEPTSTKNDMMNFLSKTSGKPK